jgi:hypothetical protein
MEIYKHSKEGKKSGILLCENWKKNIVTIGNLLND